jgi:hypothetical protein
MHVASNHGTSRLRLTLGGVVGSIVSGILSGAFWAGSYLLGFLSIWGDREPALDLDDGILSALLGVMQLGGVWGAALGGVLSCLLGHLILWLTQDLNNSRPITPILIWSIASAFIGLAGFMIVQGSVAFFQTAEFAAFVSTSYELKGVAILSGFFAGTIAAVAFFTIRNWIAFGELRVKLNSQNSKQIEETR